jgi:alkyl sulfatase BDS1-like metallo-beta-lactamase superfamily hydrolase
MKDRATCRFSSRPGFVSIVAVLSLLSLMVGTISAQTKAAPTKRVPDSPPCPVPTPTPSIPANLLLLAHTNFFCPPHVYDLASDSNSKGSFPKGLIYNAYSAVGFDLADSIMLAGPKGVVIVDTTGDVGSAQTVINQFKAKLGKTALPVQGVIYTHNHIDHIGGVQAYLDAAGKPACAPEDPTKPGQDGTYTPDAGCVAVVGQTNIIDGLTATATLSGTIINPRSGYMYGAYLGLQTGANRVNAGIGPQVNAGSASGFRLPSRTFTNQLEVDVAGLVLDLVYVPSETNDELMVFVPDAKNGGSGDGGLLLSAEVIQGPSFPNLYSLRGTSYRSPATWYKSVDTLRSFNSWCMVPSHGVPLCGSQNIQTLLVNFRDAVQFTHDQTVRYMQQGFTPDELVGKIVLPQYLLDNLKALQPAMPNQNMNSEDYLTEFYGSVRQSIREIYSGYLGWFTADPVDLNPVPPDEAAAGYVDLMGGPTELLAKAQKAYTDGRYQWAAELATLLIRINHEDMNARRLKADAFQQLSQPVTNPNWRNWYITAAEELCLRAPATGNTCLPFPRPPIPGGLTSPDIVAGLPPDKWVASWTPWLKAENNPTAQVSLGFQFPDEGAGFPMKQYVLQRDQEVVRFIDQSSTYFPSAWAAAATQIEISRPNLQTLLNNEAGLVSGGTTTALTTALHNGCNNPPVLIKVLKGACAGLDGFSVMFEQPATQSPFLTIR